MKKILEKRNAELEKDPNLMSQLVYKVKQKDSAFSTKVEYFIFYIILLF